LRCTVRTSPFGWEAFAAVAASAGGAPAGPAGPSGSRAPATSTATSMGCGSDSGLMIYGAYEVS
jgi:hypothetical protein